MIDDVLGVGDQQDSPPIESKPVLFSGIRVPFGELSADAFEKFVYLVVERLGPQHGYAVVGKS